MAKPPSRQRPGSSTKREDLFDEEAVTSVDGEITESALPNLAPDNQDEDDDVTRAIEVGGLGTYADWQDFTAPPSAADLPALDEALLAGPSSEGQLPALVGGCFDVLDGPAAGARYPISRIETVIGRSKDAGLRIEDTSISRHHAAVVFHDGEFRLRDMGTTNSTFVNRKKLEGEEILADRDIIVMGRTTMRFRISRPS